MEMTQAKRLHELYTNELRRRLAADGVCLRLEYTGSTYEGTKVRRSSQDSDLEFDIMVILRCDTDLKVWSRSYRRSLPARRYASAGYRDRNVSVRLSVRHAPVLCQNEES